MDFLQAENRFRQLRQMLAGGQLNLQQYEKEAAQLRVFGQDGAWWAIRHQDGMWVRWNGQVWKVADPPHRRSTRSVEQQPVESSSAIPGEMPAGVLLKGEEALRQLLQTGRIREEELLGGVRYLPVNLKPGGSLRGVAYSVRPDGALNPNVAILIDAPARGARQKSEAVEAVMPTVPPLPVSEGQDLIQVKPVGMADRHAEIHAAAAQVHEMVEDLEIGTTARERIRETLPPPNASLQEGGKIDKSLQALDVNLELVEANEYSQESKGVCSWWRVTGLPEEEIEGPIGSFVAELKHTLANLEAAYDADTKRSQLDSLLELCQQNIDLISESGHMPLLGGVHAASAAALVELCELDQSNEGRSQRLHMAEDHAELAEWVAREAGHSLAAVETLSWLVEVRQRALALISGVQNQAQQRRLRRSKLLLTQASERLKKERRQAARDLYSAQVLLTGSQVVDEKNERLQVLEVAQRQARAALKLAQSTGDQALAAQCNDALAQIETSNRQN